jgi:hypothetical protein
MLGDRVADVPEALDPVTDTAESGDLVSPHR